MPCIMQLQAKIISKNNFLMQLEFILFGVTNSELRFPGHFCNNFELNIAYFRKGVWGLPQWGPSQSIFRFYIASKTVLKILFG